jgi:hypothetical protein
MTPATADAARVLLTGFTLAALAEDETTLRAFLASDNARGDGRDPACETCQTELTDSATIRWDLALVPSGADDVPVITVLRSQSGWQFGDVKAGVYVCPADSTPAIVFNDPDAAP